MLKRGREHPYPLSHLAGLVFGFYFLLLESCLEFEARVDYIVSSRTDWVLNKALSKNKNKRDK